MSSGLRQIKSYLPSRLSRSCMTLPAISPAPPRDQNMYCINIPPLISQMGNGRRQGTRTWKRKDRDANYWKRVYESPNLNEEERLLARLKGIEMLPWKDIVVKFNEEMGLEMRQPALQMRLTRLAVRMDSLWAEGSSQNLQDATSISSQNIQPSYPVFDQTSSPVESVFSQAVNTNIATTSSVVPWPGINESPNYFIANPQSISNPGNSSYYDYNSERYPPYSLYNNFSNVDDS